MDIKINIGLKVMKLPASLLKLITVFVAVSLSACGGGGGTGQQQQNPQEFTVSVTVNGLDSGKQVTLQNNAGNATTVSANGSFTFSTPVAYNGSYAVTVGTQPTGQTCTVSNGSGSGVVANVGNVTVTCSDVLPLISEIATLPQDVLLFGDNQKIGVDLDGTIYVVRQVLYRQTSQSNEYIGKLYLKKTTDLSWQEAAISQLATPPAILPWGVTFIDLPRSRNGLIYVIQQQKICTSVLGLASFNCVLSANYATTPNLWNYAAEIGVDTPPAQRSDESFDISPVNINIAIIGTDDGKIFKTTDKGVTTTVVRSYNGPVFQNGYDRRIRTINYSPVDANKVWASGAEGILKSNDGGITWSISNSTPSEKLAVDKTGINIVALRQNELAYSKDEGISWRTVSGSFGYSIAWSPIETGVFYSIAQNKVYRIEIR